MDVFWKVSAGVLVAVVLGLSIAKQGKDISVLIIIASCCMVAVSAMKYFEDIIAFFEKLEKISNVNSDVLSVLLKATGIGLLAEISGLICTDAGNGALGKALQILASAVIIWIALPLFSELIELMETILGAV